MCSCLPNLQGCEQVNNNNHLTSIQQAEFASCNYLNTCCNVRLQALPYFKGVFGTFTCATTAGKPHIQNPADILLDLLSNKEAQDQAVRVYEAVLGPLHATTADQLLQGFNVQHAVQVSKQVSIYLDKQSCYSCVNSINAPSAIALHTRKCNPHDK
jgi:hypothetical protein